MKSFLTPIALIAVLGTLAWQAVDSLPLADRAWAPLVLLAILTVAASFTLVVVMPSALFRILRHSEVLLPLCILTGMLFALTRLGYLPAFSFLFNPFFHESVLGIVVSLSLLLLILIAIWVVYAAWVTPLLWQIVKEERCEVDRAFAEMPRRFLPTLGLETIGVGGTLLLLVPLLPMTREVVGVIGGIGYLFLGTIGFGWNLLTAALLPVGLEGKHDFGASVAEGFRTSLLGIRRWWLPLLLQFVLLGGFYVVHYSFTSGTEEVIGSSRSRTVTEKSGWKYGSRAFWMGGYEADTEWDDEVVSAWETPVLPIVAGVLALLFGLLALVVKVHVMERILRMRESGTPL